MSETYICPKCSGNFPDGASKCPHCGVKLKYQKIYAPDGNVCTSCNRKFHGKESRCPHCGTHLTYKDYEIFADDSFSKEECILGLFIALVISVLFATIFYILNFQWEFHNFWFIIIGFILFTILTGKLCKSFLGFNFYWKNVFFI